VEGIFYLVSEDGANSLLLACCAVKRKKDPVLVVGEVSLRSDGEAAAGFTEFNQP
jgi:hypothetical protein